ncbi:uncharacterized protein LOC121380463 [Gigantopelta aegis]|uniref:uncharacterized protein LOC121380463 n=1 Tax=Gigantopelta aegis TaxID=1735272 RepID=UPI001B88AD51|nr:uncharacterized protein LOC121380463 [Gigantopelta aegis]
MKVYIWFPKGDLYGHASLELSNGKYISWWPDEEKDRKLLTVFGSSHKSFEDDVKTKKRDPDKIFNLDHLKYDEENIEDWWIEWSDRGRYFMLGTNCCWVVYKALRFGGAPLSPKLIWTPYILNRYLKKVRKRIWPVFGVFFE